VTQNVCGVTSPNAKMLNSTGERRYDVVDITDTPSRRARLMNRLHARLATRAQPATGFRSNPEPKMIGHYARGRQLLAGNFLFSGHLIEAPGASLWDASQQVPTPTNDMHGFAWLDDLAAVGDGKARIAAQSWLADWIARYGDGRGAGWTPDITGRRLIRWIAHGFFCCAGSRNQHPRPILNPLPNRRFSYHAAGNRPAPDFHDLRLWRA